MVVPLDQAPIMWTSQASSLLHHQEVLSNGKIVRVSARIILLRPLLKRMLAQEAIIQRKRWWELLRILRFLVLPTRRELMSANLERREEWRIVALLEITMRMASRLTKVPQIPLPLIHQDQDLIFNYSTHLWSDKCQYYISIHNNLVMSLADLRISQLAVNLVQVSIFLKTNSSKPMRSIYLSSPVTSVAQRELIQLSLSIYSTSQDLKSTMQIKLRAKLQPRNWKAIRDHLE